MSNLIDRPDMSGVMASLKDFQKETVEYAFRRLYLDADSTHRFLVADEVGLGKTMVARAVIGKAIEHLWDKVARIDVVYICSNSDIARQNISRLKLDVPGNPEFARASRITLLPLELKDLAHRKVNFVSFTPGTSFDLKSNLGIAEERALLYWLLQNAWKTAGTGSQNVLQGTSGTESFRDRVKYFEPERIDPSLAQAFAGALSQRVAKDKLEGKRDVRSRFEALAEEFRDARKQFRGEASRERCLVIGELRSILARTCLHALEPDLIILDEFQRFKTLLRGDDEAAQLARALFEYSDAGSHARVLLLSATPYKMYTLAHESDDDHYQDFVETLRFLRGSDTGVAETKRLLGEYRREIYRLGSGVPQLDRLAELKEALQGELRGVMTRTERLAGSEGRDGMLVQVVSESMHLESSDVRAYIDLVSIAEHLESPDVLTYWKTAPYLLNFMDEYELKRAFETALEDKTKAPKLAKLLAKGGKALLRWDDVQAYARVDPGNARLRSLLTDTVDAGAWRLLWVPPSLPYYALEGPFAEPSVRRLTKRLVFSSWLVVPKVIASLLSYEAERQMIVSHEPNGQNTPEARKVRGGLLRFAKGERLAGMPVLALLYPSRTLAATCDPLSFALASGSEPQLASVVEWATRQLEPLLEHVMSSAPSDGRVDEAWYWAAPILLDMEKYPDQTKAWFERANLADHWRGLQEDEEEGDTAWSEHVNLARTVVQKRLNLGRPPADLAHSLAELALGGPAICALRSLWRVASTSARTPEVDTQVCDAAAQIGWASRALFNLPEVNALIRGLNPAEPYWRRVVQYCMQGGLQSVVDEYAHVLLDSEGLVGKPVGDIVLRLASVISATVSLRTSNLGVERIDASGDTTLVERRTLRARFALRFGDARNDDTNEVTRADQVRSAFNSPFWPFVLATTSVGQEGLDFHPYAHAVVHWDLPSNPVDLEQREGRVHRYKGHAVRKNLAQHYGLQSMLASDHDIARDPWRRLFVAASGDRDAGSSDLVPFWVYALPGGARIERHVPMLPLSRDVDKLTALRRSLVMYRMVFGQPRQEDLLAYLVENVPADEVQPLVARLRLDLAPPASGAMAR